MNRKQEIAAWIFGLLIALVLFVTDNGIWAFVVLGGLTILSLRDRQKKRQQTIAVESRSPEDRAAAPSDQTLKQLTPHLLAVIMLQREAEGAMPFQEWRKADVKFPPEADAMVALSCECYQLRILLDLLHQRFGSAIAQMVENSFSTLMDSDSSGVDFFARANAAILRARALGPTQDGPNDPKIRIDLQVSDQIQALSGESEEKMAVLRLPLAQCLGFARISAQAIFPDVVAKMDFDPASIALVPRETAYKGTSNRWIEKPGCFERYLQRKEGNVLFSEDERHPTDEAIHEARAKDEAELQVLDQEIKALLQRAGQFGEQETVAAGVLLNFLQHEIDPLMRRASGIGESGMWVLTNLGKLRDALFETITQKPDVKAMVKDLKNGLEGQFNPFLAQTWRDDTPIKGDEIAPSLLCESTDTVKEALELFQSTTPETVRMLNDQSAELLKNASAQGFLLPGAEEKLSLFKQHSENLKSTV